MAAKKKVSAKRTGTGPKGNVTVMRGAASTGPKNPRAWNAPRGNEATAAERARTGKRGATEKTPYIGKNGRLVGPSKAIETNFGATRVSGTGKKGDPLRFNKGVRAGMTDEQKKVAGKELERLASEGKSPRYAAARARQLATGEGAAG